MVERETWVNGAIVAVLLTGVAWAVAADEIYYVNLASRVAIIAMAGVGLNLALGYGGMVSFGHAAFFGLGGYVAGIAAYHAFDGSMFAGLLPGSNQMLVIWLFALLVPGVAALLIGAISLRTQGVYFIMITLAFAQMIYYFAISFPTYGGEDGLAIYLRNELPLIDTSDDVQFFGVAFVLLMLATWLSARLIGSRFGAALVMARLNETRLATAGIEPFPVKLVAFVISAMITGLAGALYADWNNSVGTNMLSWHLSGEIMVIVILGGVGRLFGPLAGALLFVGLETQIGAETEHWQLFLGLILLAVVLFARGGLIGALAGRARHG
ncbi:branched-chain amino acid ABC transporter permease [Rhodobacteraceae bacterium NNCM2]|nr:branched-chain amino acid ABC transporter permease [Coraliihabitans acroporae]